MTNDEVLAKNKKDQQYRAERDARARAGTLTAEDYERMSRKVSWTKDGEITRLMLVQAGRVMLALEQIRTWTRSFTPGATREFDRWRGIEDAKLIMRGILADLDRRTEGQ